MNGVLQVTIKEANAFSKAWSSAAGGFGALSKYSVYIYLNEKELGKFKASKVPYQFPLEPGEYVLQVTRNKIGGFNVNSMVYKMTDAIVGGAIAGEWDGDGLFSAIHSMGESKAREKGCIAFVVAEGQTISLEIQHNIKGNPIPVLVQ